jgi:hypothetical protein
MEEKDYNAIDGNSLVKPKESIIYRPPGKKEPRLPQIISFVLNPLFMVIYTVIIIFVYTDFKFLFANQFIRFISPVIFFSCIIPATGIYFLRRANIIKNYDLDNRNEWVLPITVFFVSYSLLFYYFFSAKLFIWFLSVMLTPLILLVIYVIISRFWRISAYMTGIGGLIGCILSVCYHIKGLNLPVLFSILIILAGCLGVSRLMLNRSTPAQVYAGFSAGIVISCLCVYAGACWGSILFLKSL